VELLTAEGRPATGDEKAGNEHEPFVFPAGKEGVN